MSYLDKTFDGWVMNGSAFFAVNEDFTGQHRTLLEVDLEDFQLLVSVESKV